MKKQLYAVGVLLALGMMLSACTEKEVPATPEQPVTPSGKFTARFVIPLTTGRTNGENEIVNAEHAASQNVAELKPVVLEVVKAAMAGTINSYPDDDSTPLAGKMTALPQALKIWAENGGPKVADSDMTVSVEVAYAGVASKGFCKLVPSYMDLIWVDPSEMYPDRRMTRIPMAALGKFMVQDGGSAVRLEDYLNGRGFEHYVISVEQGGQWKGIKTFAESRDVLQLMEQGLIEEIMAR